MIAAMIRCAAAALVLTACAVSTVSAQTRAFKPPMTPWGEPDLRGTWPLNHLISTPFQRPERFGDRRLMTDEEFAAAQKSAAAMQRIIAAII